MHRRWIVTAGACLAAAGCAMTPRASGPPANVAEAEASTWQSLITPADKDRLARAGAAWAAALAETRANASDLLEREGALLGPAAPMAWALPPEGAYRCRTVKLGVGALGGIAYAPFACRVYREGGALWMEKETGSQRQAGRIFPDGSRGIFLGGLALGDESGAISYGALDDRNVAGIVQRVDPDRWRIVIPWPRYESKVDVLELKLTE